MTFRRLTTEELAPLEKKFIQFLVSNTITGDDWANMKERRPEQAMGLIDIFSDIVFEETLKKVFFLKQTTPKKLNLFHFGEEKIEFVGLEANENANIDFTKEDIWLKNFQNMAQDISHFKTEKKYTQQREVEIFKMLENGALITDNYLFDILKQFETVHFF
jgi:hypothetical protein